MVSPKRLLNPRSTLGLGLLAVSAVPLLIGAVLAYESFRLERMGQSAEALVLAKQMRRPGGNRGRSSFQYYLRCAFETNESRAIETYIRVGRDFYDATHPGQRVAVLYDGREPTRAVVEGDSWMRSRAYLAFLLGGGMLIVAMAFLASGWSRWHRINRVLREGVPATGVITGLRRNKHYRINRRHIYFVIDYEFRDTGGVRQRGSDPLVHERYVDLHGLHHEGEIPVKFLVRHPEKHSIDFDALLT